MQGTSKQIEWAQKIKAEMMPMIAMRADQFRRAAAAAPGDSAKTIAIIDKAIEIIEQRDAAYWIDTCREPSVKIAHQVFAAAAQAATAAN